MTHPWVTQSHHNVSSFCRIGFVTQEDRLFPHLTVFETLLYAALLRLPPSLSRPQKLSQAELTLQGLGLTRCRNTIIGGPGVRGVSGGEEESEHRSRAAHQPGAAAAG